MRHVDNWGQILRVLILDFSYFPTYSSSPPPAKLSLTVIVLFSHRYLALSIPTLPPIGRDWVVWVSCTLSLLTIMTMTGWQVILLSLAFTTVTMSLKVLLTLLTVTVTMWTSLTMMTTTSWPIILSSLAISTVTIRLYLLLTSLTVKVTLSRGLSGYRFNVYRYSRFAYVFMRMRNHSENTYNRERVRSS